MRRVMMLVALLSVASVAGWGISIPVIEYKNILGNQTWTGALSFAFQVTRPITVDALGVFDSQSNGLTRDIYVEIRQITDLGKSSCSPGPTCMFSNSGTTLASSPLTSATFLKNNSYTLLGGARWQNIDPVPLARGYYMLTTRGYGNGEPNYNAGGGTSADHVHALNNLGGAIVWGIGPQYGNAYGPGDLPTIWDFNNGGGPTIRYGAGTFSVVPEPATYALMGTVGLALYLLRRRKAAANK